MQPGDEKAIKVQICVLIGLGEKRAIQIERKLELQVGEKPIEV